MKHQLIAKLALLIVWPPMALLLAALVAVVLAMVWLLIPFGVIKRKDDDTGYTITFPWSD